MATGNSPAQPRYWPRRHEFAILYGFRDLGHRKQRAALLVALVLDISVVVPLTWNVHSGGRGSYAISYFALTYVWSGGLVLLKEHWPKPYLSPTTLALVWFLPHTISLNPDDFLLRYAFAFAATLWGTMSVNKFLREAYQDLEPIVRRAGLRSVVTALVLRRAVTSPEHAPDCQLHGMARHLDLPRVCLGDELFILLRRRSLDHQFTEWRSRTIRGSLLQFESEVEDRLRLQIDECFAREYSPLSLLVYLREGGARILAKASFSTLTLSDIESPG